MNIKVLTTILSLGLIHAQPAAAQNVDLSTLPARASVQLTIYNSADLTLVRETRRASFKPGKNLLQFSWSGTRIDPTSVELRFLSHQSEIELVDTIFPHAKPQMLYWNVESERAGDVTVEVSYFTAGISWDADYVAVTDEANQHMTLESYVRVRNHSGEDYENAKVRLVVGSLNLVQRIADLAGVSPGAVQKMAEAEVKSLKHRAARRVMVDDLADASRVRKPKDVSKESLSEYYLFSVQGRETVPNGWSKRLQSFRARKVPYMSLYRYRRNQYGDQLVRLLVTKNTKKNKLGTAPLPDGIVRVFAKDEQGSLAYTGQQTIRYVPVGEDLEVLLGPDPQVLFELTAVRAWRSDFVFQNSRVSGHDEHVVYEQRIRNYSARPLNLDIRRAFTGHVDFSSQLKATKHDLHTVEVKAGVGAGKEAVLRYAVRTHHGTRAKQSQVFMTQASIQ